MKQCFIDGKLKTISKAKQNQTSLFAI